MSLDVARYTPAPNAAVIINHGAQGHTRMTLKNLGPLMVFVSAYTDNDTTFSDDGAIIQESRTSGYPLYAGETLTVNSTQAVLGSQPGNTSASMSNPHVWVVFD